MKFAIILPFLLPAALIAQEPQRPQDPRPTERTRDQRPQDRVGQDRVGVPTPDQQKALSDVIGMDVRLEPTAEEKRDAAEDGRKPERPTGSIEDLIMNANTGKIQFAVVSVGGIIGIGEHHVAIPMSSLTWSKTESDPVYLLRATEAELKALPEFDSDAPGGVTGNLRNAEKAWDGIRADWRGTVDASGDRTGTGRTTERGGRITDGQERNADGTERTVDGTTKKVDPSLVQGSTQTIVLVSQLKGADVISSDNKEFGSVSDSSINVRSNTVEYVIVGKGGVLGVGETDYLVPFQAVRPVLAGDDRDELKLALPKTTAELASAPRYTKPEHGIVSDDNCHRACTFYGVDRNAKKLDGKTRPMDPDTKKSGYDPIK